MMKKQAVQTDGSMKKTFNGNNMLLAITIILFVVMYTIGCIVYRDKGFPHLQTFLNLFITNAGLICVACGMTCVMLTGGIDISVGSLIAMDCMLLAWGMGIKGIPCIPMVLLILLIGIVFGSVQGYLIGYLEIQPFIVTMAGLFFGRGMTAVICTDQISITQDMNKMFYSWANAKITLPAFLGYTNKKGRVIAPFIRPTVLIALAVVVVIFLVLKYTKFGRALYAVGGNPTSAAMMGLNVKKIKMRAGETDKAVSFKDEKLFALIERFVRESGFRGQIDIDIFDVGGEYYISEVNPRFGGGYPHAYACGCDHMTLIQRNLQGLRNERRIGAYDTGIIMMKYNEVMIRKETEA